MLGFASNVMAMLLAALAAWFWYKSAAVRVPANHGNKMGPEIIVEGHAFIATAMKQTSWSRRGAMAAAVAAFFQAVGLFASMATVSLWKI